MKKKSFAEIDMIYRATQSFEGKDKPALIVAAEKVGLANWDYDYPILRDLNDADELDSMYFMFSCFLLLALGEEI